MTQTGIALIDALTAAVERSDADAVIKLFAPEVLPCANRNEEGFIGPRCESGMAEGTRVEAMLRAACSSDLSPPIRVAAEVSRVITRQFALDLAFRPTAVSYPPGDYIVVFAAVGKDDAYPQRIGFVIRNGGITGFVPGCPSGAGLSQPPSGEIVYQRSGNLDR